jgi:gas vesicle protein
MKKVILALAFVSTLAFVSCKESTEEKVDEATEAVGTEIETKTEDAVDAIDSTATEVGNDIKEGAEEMSDKVEEAVK